MNQDEARRDEIRQIYRYARLPDCKFTGAFQRSEEVAISRWAAFEIIKAIKDNPDVPAKDTAGWFYNQMIHCMRCSNREKQRNLFKLAADSAEEIINMI